MQKQWYKSKTIWVNLISLAALAIQYSNSSFVLSPEIQGTILALINMGLRAITKEEISWS